MSAPSKMISYDQQREFCFYLKAISNSGIVLDDDIDAIRACQQAYYDEYEEDDKRMFEWREFVICGVSLASMLLAQVRVPLMISSPLLSPAFYTGYKAFKRISYMMTKKRRRKNVLVILESFKKLPILNKDIVRYLEYRAHAIVVNPEGLYMPFTGYIIEQMDALTDIQVELIRSQRCWVIEFCEMLPALVNDYTHLIQFDPDALRQPLYSINDYHMLHTELSNTVVLFGSGIMACFAASLIPTLSTGSVDYTRLLDRLLPRMAKVSKKAHDDMSQIFKGLVFHFLTRRTRVMDIPRMPPVDPRSRLLDATYSSLANISNLAEKASVLYAMLENGDFDDPDKRTVILAGLREIRYDMGCAMSYMDLLISVYDLRERNAALAQELGDLSSSDEESEGHDEDDNDDDDNDNDDGGDGGDGAGEANVSSDTVYPENSDDEEFESFGEAAGEEELGEAALLMPREPSRNVQEEDPRLMEVLLMELNYHFCKHGRFLKARRRRRQELPPLDRPATLREIEDALMAGPSGLQNQRPLQEEPSSSSDYDQPEQGPSGSGDNGSETVDSEEVNNVMVVEAMVHANAEPSSSSDYDQPEQGPAGDEAVAVIPPPPAPPLIPANGGSLSESEENNAAGDSLSSAIQRAAAQRNAQEEIFELEAEEEQLEEEEEEEKTE